MSPAPKALLHIQESFQSIRFSLLSSHYPSLPNSQKPAVGLHAFRSFCFGDQTTKTTCLLAVNASMKLHAEISGD